MSSAHQSVGDATPNYLPARMLNEFVYCPRLFFFEWVDQVFVHNRETVEGAIRHAKVDTGKGALTPAEELAAEDRIHSQSVTLSSEAYELIAKMDLIEGASGIVTPVDYKRGSPREDRETGELSAWDADRAQLCVQALVLRDNGYHCEEGVIYYVATKQRVRVPIDEALVAETLDALGVGGLTLSGGTLDLNGYSPTIASLAGTVRRSGFISRNSGSRLFQRSACQAWW